MTLRKKRFTYFELVVLYRKYPSGNRRLMARDYLSVVLPYSGLFSYGGNFRYCRASYDNLSYEIILPHTIRSRNYPKLYQ